MRHGMSGCQDDSKWTFGRSGQPWIGGRVVTCVGLESCYINIDLCANFSAWQRRIMQRQGRLVEVQVSRHGMGKRLPAGGIDHDVVQETEERCIRFRGSSFRPGLSVACGEACNGLPLRSPDTEVLRVGFVRPEATSNGADRWRRSALHTAPVLYQSNDLPGAGVRVCPDEGLA